SFRVPAPVASGHWTYMSELQADRRFGAATRLTELNSAQNDSQLSVFRNGLLMFLTSDRIGTIGGNDIWMSVRQSVLDPWSGPANLGPTVNTASNDGSPAISSDGETLFFASDRQTGGELRTFI